VRIPISCLLPIAAIALIAASFASAAAPSTAPATAPDPHKLRIVLAGDSTMGVSSGWGPGFSHHMAADTQCINLALNGRSSKSFRNEGQWKKCLDAKPNYILIQFGHNDQPGKGPDRETDPATTYKQLMTQYVDEARAAGATPILLTSLSRRQWGADGKIHSTLVPYVEVVKEIAKEKNVPLIDLHALSIQLYEKLGKEGCNELSPTTNGAIDNTHLNAKGSDVIGALIAEQLKTVVPDLATHLK
jgi:lysophospholipase L1-like esterase